MRPDSWRTEKALVPCDLEQAVELRRAIIDAGYNPSLASSVVGWLLEKGHEDVDRSHNAQRTRYRKVLADVFGGDVDPGLREVA
jgi:hypothetical protein